MPRSIHEVLVEWLRALRRIQRDSGLSQESLAREVGVNRSYRAKIEIGASR
jgi:predicted transcriptional regulator